MYNNKYKSFLTHQLAKSIANDPSRYPNFDKATMEQLLKNIDRYFWKAEKIEKEKYNKNMMILKGNR